MPGLPGGWEGGGTMSYGQEGSSQGAYTCLSVCPSQGVGQPGGCLLRSHTEGSGQPRAHRSQCPVDPGAPPSGDPGAEVRDEDKSDKMAYERGLGSLRRGWGLAEDTPVPRVRCDLPTDGELAPVGENLGLN